MTKLETPAHLTRPISGRAVLAVLVGFPLAYWLKDEIFPWAGRLFGDHDHHAFHTFWLSVVVLHWITTIVGVGVLRRHGIQPSELGLPDRDRALRSVAFLLLVGIAFVIIRSQLGRLTIFGSTPFFGSGAPYGVAQRLVWVPVAITAGICEEFVYRGVELTLLRCRGFSVVASVAMATISFALMHGPAGIFGFPFVGALAVLMSYIYLRTGSLRPGMVLHALLDLSVILT